TFLKVVVDEDSDDEESIDEAWSAVVRWEVLPIPLGEINALYRIDVELIKTMLMHKLEIDSDFVGNDLTIAEQLIQFFRIQMTFLKVVVDEDSDDEESIDEAWSAVVRWEVLPIPLGEINAFYRIDGTTKHFATICQILHMVDQQDLMKLYGLVVQCYEHHPTTVSGEVLSMFTDVSYSLSVELIKTMLMHKLEIDSDFVGNDLTIAEQLIQFFRIQMVATQASSI
nr:hypothetical protein [Tanacetum cinerariifolium]